MKDLKQTLLNTYSPHLKLEPQQKQQLFEQMSSRIPLLHFAAKLVGVSGDRHN